MSSNQEDNELQVPKIAEMCDSCGKMFLAGPGDIYCKDCDKKSGTDFKRVRAFIQDNPGTDILTVSRATGISPSLIIRYIKGGKIEAK